MFRKRNAPLQYLVGTLRWRYRFMPGHEKIDLGIETARGNSRLRLRMFDGRDVIQKTLDASIGKKYIILYKDRDEDSSGRKSELVDIFELP